LWLVCTKHPPCIPSPLSVLSSSKFASCRNTTICRLQLKGPIQAGSLLNLKERLLLKTTPGRRRESRRKQPNGCTQARDRQRSKCDRSSPNLNPNPTSWLSKTASAALSACLVPMPPNPRTATRRSLSPTRPKTPLPLIRCSQHARSPPASHRHRR
jgi:hypothetical protein